MTMILTRQSFESGEKTIAVDVFGDGSSRGPAVLMLHGADGLKAAQMPYREGAQHLATAGYRVFLVHYLDRTGERQVSLTTLFQNFLPWTETVRDALAWITTREDVDSDRIGLVGVSLGSALGLAMSGMEPTIKAFVDYYGPLPQGALGPKPHFPPTLILHGALDPIVPVANAYAIEALLSQRGVPHDMKIYPGQGHGFTGEARTDAMERVVAFLDHHLAGRPLAAATPLPVEG